MSTTYRIVPGTTISELKERVNSCLLDNWKPLGGVAVESLPGSTKSILYQAMTKVRK